MVRRELITVINWKKQFLLTNQAELTNYLGDKDILHNELIEVLCKMYHSPSNSGW